MATLGNELCYNPPTLYSVGMSTRLQFTYLRIACTRHSLGLLATEAGWLDGWMVVQQEGIVYHRHDDDDDDSTGIRDAMR